MRSEGLFRGGAVRGQRCLIKPTGKPTQCVYICYVEVSPDPFFGPDSNMKNIPVCVFIFHSFLDSLEICVSKNGMSEDILIRPGCCQS